MTIRERVRTGIKYLNKNYPGWRNKIDTRNLNMESCSMCIMGQVAGDYHSDETISYNPRFAVKNGFNAPSNLGWEQEETYFNRLARAWTNELRQR
jgi:hypothetical protein